MSNIDSLTYTARNAYDEATECRRDLESIIQVAEEEEEQPVKKAPAKKTAMKGGA